MEKEMNKVIYMVLSEDGPIQNVNRDQSSVKKDLAREALNTALVDEFGGVKAKTVTATKYNSEENPMKNFAVKYYFDDEETAKAVASEKSKINPNKWYFISKTYASLRSEVKEPEFLLLADAV